MLFFYGRRFKFDVGLAALSFCLWECVGKEKVGDCLIVDPWDCLYGHVNYLMSPRRVGYLDILRVQIQIYRTRSQMIITALNWVQYVNKVKKKSIRAP